MRIQVMPGVRMLWIVTMKLIAPASDESDVRWRPRIQKSWPVVGLNSSVESGEYAVQPELAAPPSAKKLDSMTKPPSRKSQYESAFRRGKAMSCAPIMSGTT